jgi:anthranilate synthase/aminodeoxychorismate synthase-like glutamine amidotransferase
MPRILVVDNYDSFTFNLVQYLGELGAEPVVVRNDEKAADDVDLDEFDGLVISPGPGTPDDTGNSPGFLDAFAECRKPVLGVCLGHQLIIEHFGGKVDLAEEVRHGKTSEISHDGAGVFVDIRSPMTATRYHSLTGVQVPDALIPTASSDDDGTVQGVRHRDLPIHGVQFHPESVLTTEGKRLLANFLSTC